MKLLILLGIFLAACGSFELADIELPKNFSWTNADLDGDGIGENYVTSIKVQNCSDCYIHAAVGLLEIQFQIDHKLNTGLNLSEQSIHNCLRISCNAAGYHTVILDHIKQYGIIAEEYAMSGNWYECPNCAESILTSVGEIPVAGIPFYSFQNYQTIISPDIPYNNRKEIMVKALQSGPLVMDVNSWYGWTDNNGVLTCKNKDLSGHSTIIVGYENYGDVFLVKNSLKEGKLLKMVFEGGSECGFAYRAHQIIPGSTFVKSGLGEEFCYSMSDVDRDGIPDPHDNCPYKANEYQKNSDGDLFGNDCDPCPESFNWLTGYYCPPIQ